MSDGLANAEEWARWAAVHDDWDKTQALMGVLLAEYDRRADKLELDAEEIRQYRILIRELRAEVARLRAVVDAARTLYDVVDPTCCEWEHCALGVALEVLDGWVGDE